MPATPLITSLNQIPDAPTILGASTTLYPDTNWAQIHISRGGNPDQYFGCYVMQPLPNGYLLAGFGNRPADHSNSYLALLSRHSPPKILATLNEEGIHDIALAPNGKATILGTDPHEDWSLGNIYIYDPVENTIVKKRTIPNAIHALAQLHHPNGYWYVGTGSHTGDGQTWVGNVHKSDNYGDTWTTLTPPCNYRVYNLAWHNSLLYAAGMSQSQYYSGQATVYTSANDGASWTSTGITIRARSRWQLIPWLGLLAIGVQPNQLILINQSIQTITTPFELSTNIYAPHLIAYANSPNQVYIAGQDAIWAWDGSRWTKAYPTGGWPLITPCPWADWLLAARTHQTQPAIVAWPRHGLRQAAIQAHQDLAGHLTTNYLPRTPPLYLVNPQAERGKKTIDLQTEAEDPAQTTTGDYSAILGGHNNIASGYGATIAGGRQNEASSDYATVIGGTRNTAAAPFAVCLGRDNEAVAESAIAIGASARAWSNHMLAIAGRSFTSPGDAQTAQTWHTAELPALAQNVWYSLEPDIIIESPGIYLLNATLIGINTANTHAWSYNLQATIRATNTTTTILAQSITPLYRSDTAYEAGLQTAPSSVSLAIRRTGGTSHTSRWHAHTTMNLLKQP